MKIAIVGSRTFDNYDLLARTLQRVRKMFDDHEIAIVSGGAKGADTLAEQYSRQVLEKEPIVFPADWETYGKAAGFRRNQFIVDECDFLIAFWDGVSRGTHNSMNKAMRAKKPIMVVMF